MEGTPRRVQVAQAVAARMADIGMTVEDLAAQAAIPADNLTAHLAGQVAFDVDELEAVALVLGVKAGRFFDV